MASPQRGCTQSAPKISRQLQTCFIEKYKSAMPTLLIKTNVAVDDAKVEQLGSEATDIISNLIVRGKPKQYVMVEYQKTWIMFGGDTGPACFMYLTSIGKIGPDINPEITAQLSSLLAKHCQVQKSRVYIQFVDAARSDFGWNGTTFG